jgi:hypothetical protein
MISEFIHIALLNPISELIRMISEINEVTDTKLISDRGYKILNDPILLEETNLQIDRWKRDGGNGICIINLNNRLYEKRMLIERLERV